MTEVGPNGDKSDVTLLTGHDEGLPDRSPPTSRAGLVVAGLVAVAVLGGLIALTSSPSPDEQPPETSEHDPTEGSPSEVGLVDASEPAGSALQWQIHEILDSGGDPIDQVTFAVGDADSVLLATDDALWRSDDLGGPFRAVELPPGFHPYAADIEGDTIAVLVGPNPADFATAGTSSCAPGPEPDRLLMSQTGGTGWRTVDLVPRTETASASTGEHARYTVATDGQTAVTTRVVFQQAVDGCNDDVQGADSETPPPVLDYDSTTWRFDGAWSELDVEAWAVAYDGHQFSTWSLPASRRSFSIDGVQWTESSDATVGRLPLGVLIAERPPRFEVSLDGGISWAQIRSPGSTWFRSGELPGYGLNMRVAVDEFGQHVGLIHPDDAGVWRRSDLTFIDGVGRLNHLRVFGAWDDSVVAFGRGGLRQVVLVADTSAMTPRVPIESDLETIPMEWERMDLPDGFGFAKVIDIHIFAAIGNKMVRIEADLQTTETITVPTPVRHFDVAGDTIVVASQPNWDAGCDEPETPAVVISYDGGATWAEVDLPWNLQVGRLTSRGYLTVAANEHATLIARDSMPSFLASSGCLGDLAGLGSDVYVNRVTDTGVVFDLNSGGSEVVTWSEMELTDEEISYMREATIGESIPEATPIYRVDGTTALETSSVGGLIWSTDGRFVVFDWASGPPSSVRVSDDATDWETINVGQNSWFSNSLHRSTGEGVEYSLDGGRTWSAVPRPPRSFEVTGYVEIDGFTVANRNDVARDSLPAFHHESGQWVELESPDPELRGQVLGVVDHRLAVVAWTSLGPRLFVGRPAEIGEPVSPGG